MTMVSYKEIRDGLIRVRVLEHYDCGNADPKNVAKLIGKYKNTGTVSHGYLWKTIEKELR